MKFSVFAIIGLVLAAFLFILEVSLGSVNIPFSDVMRILMEGSHENRSWTMIILESRLPRAIAALSIGASLSVSGLFMQSLFRNPLAGPHILGVSAGSSLGVAFVLLAFSGFISYSLASNIILLLASFIGAFAVLGILFLVSLRFRDVLTVLIFGILIGAISLAIVGILQYASAPNQLKAFLIWTLGSFDGLSHDEAKMMLFVSIPLLLVGFYFVKTLNALLAGEEYAQSFGINTRTARLGVMALAGGLTALATAFCGPIGFVGVVVPHFCRMFLKTFDHKLLIPASIIVGINLMLFADLVAHMPYSDYILPLNSITSLIGIPFIFWILLKKKNVVQV